MDTTKKSSCTKVNDVEKKTSLKKKRLIPLLRMKSIKICKEKVNLFDFKHKLYYNLIR